MNLLFGNWTLIGIGALVAVIATETVMLTSAWGKIDVFEEREAAQKREQARRDMHNIQSKERANESRVAARKRASTVVVRHGPSTITVGTLVPRSDNKAAECVTRGDLDAAVADFAVEHAEGLADVVAEVSRRLAAEATVAAREFEAGFADYRSCRAYAIEVE